MGIQTFLLSADLQNLKLNFFLGGGGSKELSHPSSPQNHTPVSTFSGQTERKIKVEKSSAQVVKNGASTTRAYFVYLSSRSAS